MDRLAAGGKRPRKQTRKSAFPLALIVVQALSASMNNKQRAALKAVFSEPTSGTVPWASIEGLLMAIGCKVIEGKGSRVRFARDGRVALFHRPHPEKEAKRYQVEAAREYLIKLGVQP